MTIPERETKSPTALFQSVQDGWTLFIGRLLLCSLSQCFKLIEAFLSRQGFYTDAVLYDKLSDLSELIDEAKSRLEKYHL